MLAWFHCAQINVVPSKQRFKRSYLCFGCGSLQHHSAPHLVLLKISHKCKFKLQSHTDVRIPGSLLTIVSSLTMVAQHCKPMVVGYHGKASDAYSTGGKAYGNKGSRGLVLGLLSYHGKHGFPLDYHPSEPPTFIRTCTYMHGSNCGNIASSDYA